MVIFEIWFLDRFAESLLGKITDGFGLLEKENDSYSVVRFDVARQTFSDIKRDEPVF